MTPRGAYMGLNVYDMTPRGGIYGDKCTCNCKCIGNRFGLIVKGLMCKCE
jgi:hypothetical protein